MDNAASSNASAATATISATTGTRSPAYFFLALLVIAAIAIASWQGLRLQSRTQQQNALVLQLQNQINAQQARFDTESAVQRQAVLDAQTRLQAQEQLQIDLRAIVAGGAQKFADAQRLHAAQYLIYQAEQVLLLAQDVPAASKLLENADAQLAGSSDNSFSSLRASIKEDRQHLQQVASVDALMVARQLAELGARVPLLRDLVSELKTPAPSVEDGSKDMDSWDSLLANLQRFSGDWFLVQHHTEMVQAPLTALESRQIKQAILLAISTAQLAALHHEQGLYYNAINQALQMAEKNYGNSQDGAELVLSLQGLAQKLVSVNATLSLRSAQSLREHGNAEGAAK